MARPTTAHRKRRRNELGRAMSACRSAFGTVAVFSMLINVLMLASPLYMLQVYDRVLTTGHVETLAMLTALAAVALLLLGALEALRSAVMVRIGCWLNDRLGPVYLENGVRMRLLGDSAGAQPLRDLAQVQAFVSSPALMLFFDAPWVPVFVALTWFLHPWLGMLATAAAMVLLALGIANEWVTRQANLTATMAQIAATQQAETAIRNAEVVRAMSMLPAMVDRWRTVNGQSLDAVRVASERGGMIVGLTKSLRFLVQVGVLGLGALLVLRGELTPGSMIASSILLGRALAPVELAMSAWRTFSTARIAYSRLWQRLQNAPDGVERTRLPAPEGRLSVENASYAPPGAREAVLSNVSFTIGPGEALAIIGPSAGGKSTLCRLLVGIASPTSGEIRLDGSELDHWDPRDLGRHIGYLPQDVELFAGTVRENIARMTEGDHDDVVLAARLAHAHELIQRLPEGYETQIGEGGARLSGGQRQRIGLARALYGAPRLIILDEPNANLDQAGEAALSAAVNDIKSRGGVVIIVGHRPSTIAQADRILLLRDGRVDLFGPREQVLQKLRKASAATAAPEAGARAEQADLPARTPGDPALRRALEGPNEPAAGDAPHAVAAPARQGLQKESGP